MSIRLNVIYSSPIGTSAAHQAHEEALIMHLISQPGLDLNLVGPLENLAQSPTDLLLLDGFKGDLAVISWSTPEQSAQWLRQSGIPGARTPHRLDPDAQITEPHSEIAPRKWYLIDPRNTQHSEVLEGLRGILHARRTPTVSLSLSPTTPPAQNLNSEATRPRQATTAQHSPKTPPKPPLTTNSITKSSTPAPLASELAKSGKQAQHSQIQPRNQENQKDALDHLMDDLDAWDTL